MGFRLGVGGIRGIVAADRKNHDHSHGCALVKSGV